MLKVKGFGYDTERDREVIEHIEKQPHQAQYIINLVRADMNKEEINRETIENIVKNILENYLSGIEIRKEVTSINPSEIMNILSM